jgi:hypothetical protein
MLKHETTWNEIFSVTDIFNRKHHILGHANSKPLPHPLQQKKPQSIEDQGLEDGSGGWKPGINHYFFAITTSSGPHTSSSKN